MGERSKEIQHPLFLWEAFETTTTITISTGTPCQLGTTTRD